MNRKKFFTVLGLILFIAICANIGATFNNPVWRKKTSRDLIKLGMTLSDKKIYTWSNWMLAAGRKLNPNAIWIDFNIARNKHMDARDNNYSKRYKTKMYNEAILLFNRELERHPNDYKTISSIGNIYKDLENFETAAAYFRRALEINPNDKYSIYELIFVDLYALENYDEALELIDRYLTLDPSATSFYFTKAFLFGRMERDADAILWYKKYLEIYPNNVAALVNISGHEIEIRDWVNAEKHVNLGLKFNKTSAYLLSYKIDILIHNGKYEEAAKEANALIDRNSDNGYIGYWKLAKIEMAKHNNNKADEYFEKSKQNAQEYFDNICKQNRYDFNDIDGKCSNRYYHIKNFEKNKREIVL